MTDTTEGANVTVETVAELSRRNVDDDRWCHVEGVVELCSTLRESYPYLPDRELTLAAYLHDAAKNLPRERQRELADRYRSGMDPVEASIPALWHAPASAQIGVEQLELETNTSFLRAVSFHSTGHFPMDDLLQGLFVADFCEPGRTFPEARDLRQKIGNEKLSVLSRTVLCHKITRCLDECQSIHPWSVEAFNELCD